MVVNGTRILAPRVLDSIRGRFLNMHAGITPAFRGLSRRLLGHCDGQADLAGTTVHWIDRGIDTGPIVKQALIEPGPRDNFATYPYLQMAAGLPLLAETVSEWFEGKVVERQVRQCESAGSKRYDHPTVATFN